MLWEYFQINFISIYVCRVYPDEMHHSVHEQWHGCSTEDWKKHRKERPESHEERNLETWGADVPDDSVPDKRLLSEVNKEVCRRRLMHRLIIDAAKEMVYQLPGFSVLSYSRWLLHHPYPTIDRAILQQYMPPNASSKTKLFPILSGFGEQHDMSTNL